MGIFAQLAERGTWTGSYTLKDPALAELYGYGRQTLAGNGFIQQFCNLRVQGRLLWVLNEVQQHVDKIV